MAHESSPIRRSVRLAAGAVVAVGLFSGTPALALDDGQENILDSILGLVKMGIGVDEDEKPAIDYRERAPLVVPPKMELRQPLPPVASRNQAWPLDQDLARQRAAAADAARPRGVDVEADTLPARDLQKFGRLATPAGRGPEEPAGGCTADGDVLCNPTDFWARLRTTRLKDDSTKDLVAGVEPPRSHLTEPPTGYRKPTKAVKYTYEPRDLSYDDNLGSGAAQTREEARRRREAQ